MHDLFNWFAAHAMQNQVFSGVIGAGLIGTLAYSLKSIPMAIYYRIKWLVTVKVSIGNDLSSYDPIVNWIGARMNNWYVRELRLSHDEPDDDDDDSPSAGHANKSAKYNLTPGYGSQWLFLNGWPYIIDRKAENAAHASATRVRETLDITTFGFSRKKMTMLLEAALESMVEQKGIGIHIWRSSWWNCIEKRSPRPLDSVVLADGFIESMIDDMDQFIAARDTYVRRGIPYRRGYLFAGSPGTGKSSLAVALAGHYKMPIYMLNLGSIGGDDTLMDAVGGVPATGILVIEDIDAATAAVTREDDNKKKESKITLSGLLNCLDGIVAKESRILIMTSNHPERLDPALIRPGRVDRRVEFTLASADEAARLFLRFFEEAAETANWLSLHYTIPLSAAEIQGHCQNFEGFPISAAQAICSHPRVAQLASV